MECSSGLRPTKSGGFTLIELMIVVAIVAILVVIGLPAYQEQQRKARRADAQATLSGLAVAMERFFNEQSPSTYVGAALGSSGIYPDEAPVHGSAKYYDLSIAASDPNSFTLNAAPKNSQAGDDCGTLTLTETGVRDASGPLDWSDCWR